MEGTDPKLKNEYLIISVHYDHLEIGAIKNPDSIYNAPQWPAGDRYELIGKELYNSKSLTLISVNYFSISLKQDKNGTQVI